MKQEELSEKVSRLKRDKNAVILAHNYQRPEVQLVADYLGDSLELARGSTELDSKLVIFAGVDFMAETAAMLNPDKKIVIPDLEAICPMAAQLSAEQVKRARKEHPGAAVALYVNTLAEAKAESDIATTSANATKVVNSLEEDTVLYGPDWNLAWHVQQNSDKHIIPIPERGYCYVHKMFSPADIQLLKNENPDAEVLVHPECDPEVQKLADHICSTSQMLRLARESRAKKFIIGTEVGLIERLRRELPDKEFIPALDTAICKEMKRHTLEKVYLALRDERYVVKVPPEIADRARATIERMLKVG